VSEERELPPRLAELCHQLSQPLTVARCSLELAQAMAADNPGRGELLEDARQAIERMVAITAAIRDWRGE
jgi:signal transduction histidine kinase